VGPERTAGSSEEEQRHEKAVACRSTGRVARTMIEIKKRTTGTVLVRLRLDTLVGVDLHNADLRGACLDRANLTGADLHGADLSLALLRWAEMRGANLTGANLERAKLRNAWLRRANARGARLTGAGLRVADLGDVDLTEADLQHADLRCASLRGANLYKALLQEARLQDADLTKTDLRRIRLSGARHDRRTRWPAGFDPVAHTGRCWWRRDRNRSRLTRRHPHRKGPSAKRLSLITEVRRLPRQPILGTIRQRARAHADCRICLLGTTARSPL
jgi:uncharacterized protein YjbI with pentapeptide repeats